TLAGDEGSGSNENCREPKRWLCGSEPSGNQQRGRKNWGEIGTHAKNPQVPMLTAIVPDVKRNSQRADTKGKNCSQLRRSLGPYKALERRMRGKGQHSSADAINRYGR